MPDVLRPEIRVIKDRVSLTRARGDDEEYASENQCDSQSG